MSQCVWKTKIHFINANSEIIIFFLMKNRQVLLQSMKKLYLTGSPNTNCRFLFGSYLNMHTISVEWKHDFSTIPMYIFSCYVKKFINSTIRVKLGLITFWWKFQVFLELWYFLQLFWGIFLINLFWKLNFIFFCFPCYSKW